MRNAESKGLFSTPHLILGAGAIAAWYYWANIQAFIAPYLPAALTPAPAVNPVLAATVNPTGALDPTVTGDPTTQAQATAALLASQGYSPTQQAVAAQQVATSATVSSGAIATPLPPATAQALQTAIVQARAERATIAPPPIVLQTPAIPDGGPAIYGPSINGQPPSMTMAQYQAWQLNTLLATAAATPPPSA